MRPGAIGAIFQLVAGFTFTKDLRAFARIGHRHQFGKIDFLFLFGFLFSGFYFNIIASRMFFAMPAPHMIDFLGNPIAKQKDQQCAAKAAHNFGKCHRV